MLSRKLQVLRKTIVKLLRRNAHLRIRYIIEKVHSADLALLFRFLNEEQQEILFSLLGDAEKRAELLEDLDDSIARRLISDYSIEQIAELVRFMSDDDAADLIQDLGKSEVLAILAKLKKDDREDLKELMQYDEETAGGLMTTDFLAVKSGITAGEATRIIQEAGEEAEMVFYIYAVDGDGRLEGVVSLREIVQADDERKIADIMETDIHKVRADVDQEEVARIIEHYDLLAVPVVNEENIIIGIITVDDIIDIIREEATEDILKLVGADEELLEDYSLKKNIMSRLPWLLATWIGGIFIMKLVGAHQEQLSRVVALTAFFPVILAMSGNVGQQSATIIVRGLAIGKVNLAVWFDTITKETLTGLVIGLIYGSLLGIAAWIQFGDQVANIPIVVGLSQCLSMGVAAILGAMVPMLLFRFNIDPAVATGPIVTTSLDLIGMWIYMTIATILIF